MAGKGLVPLLKSSLSSAPNSPRQSGPAGPSAPSSAPESKHGSTPEAEGRGLGSNLLRLVFGTAFFAKKWQQKMTAERQERIIEMFTVPRDDPNDVYKQNSPLQTQLLAETPPTKPLDPERIEMLQEIAANYDQGCQLDVIEAFHPKTPISHESREQLFKLPTWLRFLVTFKYDEIHARFGHHTHHFLKVLNIWVETKRAHTLNPYHVEQKPLPDVLENIQILGDFLLREDDLVDNRVFEDYLETQNLTEQEKADERRARQDALQKNDLMKLKMIVRKWQHSAAVHENWAPHKIHRAAITLRRALKTEPTEGELAIVAEDEKIAKTTKAKGALEDEDEMETKASWDDIIVNKQAFKDEIAQVVEADLRSIPIGLPPDIRLEEERLIRERERQGREEALLARSKSKIRKLRKKLGGEKSKKKHKRTSVTAQNEDRLKKQDLMDRNPARKFENLWFKNCPMEQIKQARRFQHRRWDESFHAYILALVGTDTFKMAIMLVILVNAIVLALENEETKENTLVSYMFNFMDNFFLSVYLAEFLLKIYAHPYRYWLSGFNIFDFFILLVSLIQATLAWTDVTEYAFLKILVIFRALRILRSISMSVQIQVLISALVETLKTHVLSVLILLFLLIYIASIIAYYMFGHIGQLKEVWGNIMLGMLKLFSFVTMEGWTDTTDLFEAANFTHQGRIFGLIGILIGSFLIANIFIAIIIMQISEATDAFRAREKDEREDLIAMKKEIVFRRQKLDMRQLLAKQQNADDADFYYLAGQFLKLLRHDDLFEMKQPLFSPLWIDSFYKCYQRSKHTANILMNLHRQMADNLLEVFRLNNTNKYNVSQIRRSRYNRYMKLKSKLAIIRQEFYRDQPPPGKEGEKEGGGPPLPPPRNKPLRIRIEKEDENQMEMDQRSMKSGKSVKSVKSVKSQISQTSRKKQ